MMTSARLKKILENKNIETDVESFILPDGMKLITLRYDKVEIDYTNGLLNAYVKNSEIKESFDLEQIIGVQFYTGENTDMMRAIRKGLTATY